MTCRQAGRYVAVLGLVLLVVWGSVEGYRGFSDVWEGNLRAPLIAGSFIGIALILFGSCLVPGVNCGESQSEGSPAPIDEGVEAAHGRFPATLAPPRSKD